MKKLYETFCKIEVAACGIGFVFLVAFIFLSAILRFAHVSMSWNIDLALFLLAWTAFLGADVAWRSGQLKGIDLFTRKLPIPVKHVLTLIIYIIVILALVIVVIFGVRLAWTERLRTYQSIPIPFSLVTLSVVVAAFSMIISTCIKIAQLLKKFGQADAIESPEEA